MYSEYVDMWGAVFGRPVLVDSQRWNGWAIPYFSEEDLPELIEFMNAQEFTGAPFKVEPFGVRGTHTDINCCDPNDVPSISCVCVCCECVDTFEWEYFEGGRVVSVGGGAWCWSSSAPEDLAEEILESFDDETERNFELLRIEEIHRTQIQFSPIQFVLGLSRWNGWELYKPEEFARAVNESAEMLVNN